MVVPSDLNHELKRIRECSLASDGLIWNDGWNKAVCSCGWVSAAMRGKDKNTALVALFEVHVKTELMKAQIRAHATDAEGAVIKAEPKQLATEKRA